ncbi:hypothetical protein RS75_00255 [Rhizobium nepotum 39/7]|uniref:Uncharacterized protein n=1 Tax=Rhizobium nepotum 39/7 TaxID=1368418 RepID=A0ABR5CY80_9HYPH|nr:hypothetical protein RS75_00255 [Rhizobium nepotum 39/7]
MKTGIASIDSHIQNDLLLIGSHLLVSGQMFFQFRSLSNDAVPNAKNDFLHQALNKGGRKAGCVVNLANA